MVLAIAMGSAVATSMLGVMLGIGDKMNRELRSAGANISVVPAASGLTGGVGVVTANIAGGENFIPEAKVLAIKSIFWGLNVTGLSPSLEAHDGPLTVAGVWFNRTLTLADGQKQLAGVKQINPNWQVSSGKWASDAADVASGAPDEVMVGSGVAKRRNWAAGQTVAILGKPFRIAGVLSSGDEADDQVLMPLKRLQELTGRGAQVDRIQVAALTKPEDDFARKDFNRMNREEYDRWYCTPYVTSIAKQIEEIIPGAQARAVRRVADAEGKILNKIGGLMSLITLAALLSAGLTVWSLTATTMMERRAEVAVMRAIGSSKFGVGALFGLEIAAIGLAGGVLGTLAGVFLARFVSQSVFHDQIEISVALPGMIIAAAVVVALLGAAQPLRRTLGMEPAVILRGGV